METLTQATNPPLWCWLRHWEPGSGLLSGWVWQWKPLSVLRSWRGSWLGTVQGDIIIHTWRQSQVSGPWPLRFPPSITQSGPSIVHPPCQALFQQPMSALFKVPQDVSLRGVFLSPALEEVPPYQSLSQMWNEEAAQSCSRLSHYSVFWHLISLLSEHETERDANGPGPLWVAQGPTEQRLGTVG